MEPIRQRFSRTSALLAGVTLISARSLIFSGCKKNSRDSGDKFDTIEVPAGFKIEKVVGGLNFPTAAAWDGQGKMYVLEAGGGFLPEPSPARILQVEKNKTTELVNLTGREGVQAPVVGLSFHNKNFYITHRANDMTGAVSRVSNNGSSITKILRELLDSGAEHPLNDVRMGPDGRMYLAARPEIQR